MASFKGISFLIFHLVFHSCLIGVYPVVLSVQRSVSQIKCIPRYFTDRCDICYCIWCDFIPDLNQSRSGYELKPHDALQCQTDGKNHSGHHKPGGYSHSGWSVRRRRTLAHCSRSVVVFGSAMLIIDLILIFDIWWHSDWLSAVDSFSHVKYQAFVLWLSPQRFLKQTRALKKGWSSKLSSSSSWMRSLPSYTLHFLEAGG